MTTTYAIKDWDATFENRRTREIACPDYVNWPTHQDSEGFGFLARTEGGTTALGVFGALVQFAAKRPLPRCGVLEDERGPMTPERYSVRYGLSVAVARAAWSLLASPDVGWLVPHKTCEARANGSALATPVAAPHADAPPTHRRPGADTPPMGWKGLEGIGEEGIGKHIAPSAKPPPDAVRVPEQKGPRGFEDFWRAWPKNERKTAKWKCLGVWRRVKLEPLTDQIVAAVEGWKKTESWTKDGGRFVPMPLTWLNGRRWEEVPEPVTALQAIPDQSKNIAAMEAAVNGRRKP